MTDYQSFLDSKTIIRVMEKFIQYPWGISVMAEVMGLPKVLVERIYRTLDSWGVIAFGPHKMRLVVDPLVALTIVRKRLESIDASYHS